MYNSLGLRQNISTPLLSTLATRLEKLRVYLHLWCVELRLRMVKTDHLSEKLKQQRQLNLNRLQTYRKQGVFPKNLDFPLAFVPYFKDAYGTPCAVAHLMEQSGARQIVTAVAKSNNHIYVNSISGGPALAWIKQSGLTQKEAARIQPQYGCGPGWGDICSDDPAGPAFLLVFIIPALVNIVAISGLLLLLGRMLFRSKLVELKHNLGRKKSLAVIIVTLLTPNAIILLTHYSISNSYGDGMMEMLIISLIIITSMASVVIPISLIKLILRIIDRKKESFITSLIGYPLISLLLLPPIILIFFLFGGLIY